jgi:hypothetical protein
LVRLGEIGDRKHALDARLELTGRNKSHANGAAASATMVPPRLRAA